MNRKERKNILKTLKKKGRYQSPMNRKYVVSAMYTLEEVKRGLKEKCKVKPREWAICSRIYHHEIGYADIPITGMYFNTPEEAVDKFIEILEKDDVKE